MNDRPDDWPGTDQPVFDPDALAAARRDERETRKRDRELQRLRLIAAADGVVTNLEHQHWLTTAATGACRLAAWLLHPIAPEHDQYAQPQTTRLAFLFGAFLCAMALLLIGALIQAATA